MANLITTARRWRNKLILFKAETGYGTDAAPTAVANYIDARNVSFVPSDPVRVARNVELPYRGKMADITAERWAKLSFDVPLAPSGTAGTAPKWGVLNLACGMAETITATTSVAYNLISSAFQSGSAYMHIDGQLYKLIGARGNVKGKLSKGGIPMLSYDFDALYTTPGTLALPTATKTGWTKEEIVNSANTIFSINGIALPFTELTFDIGNKTSRLSLPGPQLEVDITDGEATASCTVLAPDLVTFNPFSIMEAETTIPISATHGSAAGKKAKVDIQAKIANVENDQIEGRPAYKITFDPEPVLGNDEMALTCT